MFHKKGVLKNFANFTGNNLYRNFFLIKLQAWKLFFKNTYFENHLRTTASVISRVTANPKDNGFTIPWNYIIVLCYNGTPLQTFVLKFSKIFWGYSGWRLPKLSQNTFSHYYCLNWCHFDDKRLHYWCFFVNSGKFLKTERLLLRVIPFESLFL